MPPEQPPGQRTAGYDYLLPASLIAQRPAARRPDSTLMRVPAKAAASVHQVRDLPGLLAPGDLLIVNRTRVLPARLRAAKESGGKVEILVEETDASGEGLALLRSSKPARPGTLLRICPPNANVAAGGPAESRGERPVAEVLERLGDAWRIRLSAPLREIAERYGTVPLPPYVRRNPGAADSDRYQTVFARPGAGPLSSAAPTAGLHFDRPLLQALERYGVGVASLDLQVGLGTFLPVRAENPAAHRMHAESYALDAECAQRMRRARRDGGRLVAVGTTVVRALEAARREIGADDAGVPLAGEGRTQLFIRPPFDDFCTDMLMTNFHAPRSTLLMLVAAYGGYRRVMDAYRSAVARGMRFLSYGDCMLLARQRG